MTYLVFYNPNAGNTEIKVIAQKVKAALEQQKINVVFVVGQDADDALQQLERAIPEAAALICIGGDGSINLAMTAILKTKTKIKVGIIPGGTVNNFTKALGIPQDIDDAIHTLITGKTRQVDLGQCNEQAVVSSLVFGTLADISNNVRQEEKRRFGKFIYVMKGLKGLLSQHAYRIALTRNNQTMHYKIWTCLITTSNYIAGYQYLAKDTSNFKIMMLHNFAFTKIPAYIYYLFTGRLKEMKGTTVFTADQLKFTVDDDTQIRVRIDGDAAMTLPINLVFYPKVVYVITPK
ncbi:diacylglycerol/lipid kinase family protein [Agrilactobacillus fermenti]|uniref:diacylglycerol/lipid kinase family protein n=1 Tax=Agrilactobacillus fermenti TaxID=2586909 RepID=UPI001E33D9AC|nr:diacylglycerol kinase family protein [Agrilactobacillus fermenti]MCD2255857.1 diacylglycerol kinase family lipid kinase [Agrilactobacillus fermenti]